MNWALASSAVLLVALGAMVVAFERGAIGPRTLGLVAALASLAVAGRLAFAPLPNVKPTTDIVLIAGLALGARCGFAVGAITALVSNMFYGQGPWTPWQMLGWGMAGLLGAALARLGRQPIGRWQLAAAGAVAGVAFGVLMDVSEWLFYSGSDPRSSALLARSLTSLPFNFAHVGGNIIFALAFGPTLLAAVERVRQRSLPQWLPPGESLMAFAVPPLLAVALLQSPDAGTSGVSVVGVRASASGWLASAQQDDGGFPVVPGGGGSSPRETAWAAIALEATGRQPAVLSQGGRTLLARLESDSRNLFVLTDGSPEERAGFAQRLLLAATGAGANGRNFGGRDLVAWVRRGIGRGGYVSYRPGEPSVDLTAYAVMSLRSAALPASDPAIRRAVRWLVRERQRGGGWSTVPRSLAAGSATADTTGAVLQALRAAGHPRDTSVRSALAFLMRSRKAGGWGFGPFGANAQSTALAVLGLRAWSPGLADRGSGWFVGSRGKGGSISYQPRPGGSESGSYTQTPVWVTAQAVLAMSGRVLPLRTVDSPVVPASGREGSPDGVRRTRAGHSAASSRQRLAAVAANPLLRQALAGGGVGFSARAARLAGTVAGALAKSFSGSNR